MRREIEEAINSNEGWVQQSSDSEGNPYFRINKTVYKKILSANDVIYKIETEYVSDRTKFEFLYVSEKEGVKVLKDYAKEIEYAGTVRMGW
jgi:hypothetical protein